MHIKNESRAVQCVKIPVLPVGAARTVEHVPVPHILKEAAGAVTVVPFERVQQQTIEHIAGTPQFMEETVEEEKLVPRERVQQRINEQIVDVLFHIIRSDLPAILASCLSRCSHQRVCMSPSTG